MVPQNWAKGHALFRCPKWAPFSSSHAAAAGILGICSSVFLFASPSHAPRASDEKGGKTNAAAALAGAFACEQGRANADSSDP